MSKKLTAKDALTQQLNTIGISTWTQLIAYIKQLPYGLSLIHI